MNKRILYGLIILIVLAVGAAGLYVFGGAIWKPMVQKSFGGKTTAQVIDEIRPLYQEAIRSYCADAGLTQTPKNLTLVALKEEQKLEIWTQQNGAYKHLHTFDILASSGTVARSKKRETVRYLRVYIILWA